MGEYKPLGSEKLTGTDKLKRILELTYYNTENKKSKTNNPELVRESKNGGIYGIVKEKDGYYVKKGLNEQSLDYIGGLFMKNKNKFNSYAEALKRMELLKGQEELNEATKYVLKQKSPQSEAPAPETPMDMPADTPPAPPAPSDVAPSDAPMEPSTDVAPSDAPMEPSPEMSDDQSGSMDNQGSETGKPSDYMAEVQKFAGKLGQELRDQKQKMESDDIKYVLNMIISAVDLNKLDLEDLEEIGKKFDRDEEEGSESPETENSDEEEETSEPSVPSPEEGDQDLGETMDKLEEFINTPIETDEIDLSSYADIDENDEDVQELDMDEIKNAISTSIGETLSKYFKH